MRNLYFTIALLAWSLSGPTTSMAQERPSGIQCVAEQLASCKIKNTVVNASALSQYGKAFNCMKYGSTTGTKFDFNIPLPDAGVVGFGFGDSAQHTTDVCSEEIKKFQSTSFVKTYSEVFSAECGKTLAGQYEQCLQAKIALEKAPSPTTQVLQCNAMQSSRNLVINLRYKPAVQEIPANYTVATVAGVSGMTCETGVVPGIYSPTSMHCELPPTYTSGTAIVRLANTVSCEVSLLPERSVEIASAKKHSCAAVLNRPSVLGDLPPLVRLNAIGMCDACLAANLGTPDSDQRTLKTRLRGCLAWSVQSLGGTSFCSARPMPPADGAFPNPFANPFGGGPTSSTTMAMPPGALPNPFMVPPGGPTPNPEVKWGFLTFANASPVELALRDRAAKELCNVKSNVDVLQREKGETEAIPIDFLATAQGQHPALAELLKDIDQVLK